MTGRACRTDATPTSPLAPARFCPPVFLRPAMIQTLLASAALRAWGKNSMLAAACETVLTSAEGVRLLGYMSRQPRPHQRGTVVLLHGWEGSANSTYIRTTGRFLFRRGFDVFRLNFRDHGSSHHLNPGIFYAVLLDEVFDAVRQVAEKERGRPIFLAGFSLGGNFALRIARKCAQAPIPGLRHVFAISPVLDPDKATDRIDANRFILHYFLKKWRRSLNTKQHIFPERYDFSDLINSETIREMTERLLVRYSAYDSAMAYFNGYNLVNDGLSEIQLPTTIVTAEDDPIIPVDDFYDLVISGTTRIMVQPHGGHNGFLEGWRMTGWYERVMAETFGSS
ncbi:YheT family hydrolase [Desulfosarcina ovata]|uniref:YheT family hydrolase n=1 Tax=Desulfosarcina ovata TaxID=83564 RepID=UPI0013920839|nr:alpha/beta fold hydrolase [Desulfosarcina ovata]